MEWKKIRNIFSRLRKRLSKRGKKEQPSDKEKLDTKIQTSEAAKLGLDTRMVKNPIERSLESCIAENTPWLSLEGQTLCCKCISVTDGDTVTLIVPFGGEYYKKKCRLLGIDTAETGGKASNEQEKEVGAEAKARLEELILNKIIIAECGDWDKFGRLLVTLRIGEDDEMSINDKMVAENYGYYYSGKCKKRKFEEWYQ